MKHIPKSSSVRLLPEAVTNKIAAGEVIERPASAIKELIENALDAGATRITIRIDSAGKRRIEVIDNGRGMSEQDAMLAVERHTTSKIRTAEDLDNILTFGFRGEALSSIAAVSRFELITRRTHDEAATRIRIEGGILRDISQAAAPPGTRVTANHLYFNTPVRAKFLKGESTELNLCIDCVQRFAFSATGVAFELLHNDKTVFQLAENASLLERAATIWGFSFSRDLVELHGERLGLRFSGLIGTPNLTRSSRSHQYFFLNGRPISNPSLLYGFEEAYHQLITIGRKPVGLIMLQAPPRSVDVNIHPAKREVRFRDERATRNAIREIIRERLASLPATSTQLPTPNSPEATHTATTEPESQPQPQPQTDQPVPTSCPEPPRPRPAEPAVQPSHPRPPEPGIQAEFSASPTSANDTPETLQPAAVLGAYTRPNASCPMQLFDTYLLIPEEDRLLIIDQHALHERLTYDSLHAELADKDYAAQRLIVPILIEIAPSYAKLLESNLQLFNRLGIELEPFGGNTFQVTSICHLYDESRIPDTVCRLLDQLAQGDLFMEQQILDDLLRTTIEACRSSVKAGDPLSPEERYRLLEGFRTLRPPYTCPHGRPIITELTQAQMEKSFRRRQ